jgi:uncharacterized protein
LVCEGENDENSIIIYGGEPLLKIDVIGLIAQSVSERKKRNTLPGGLHVSLVTNGSLLNKENAVFLKDNNIAVSISLDGDEVATNSCRRYSNGRSVYDDIRRAIKCCREVELDFSLSVTITESLLSNPASSLDTLIRDIGVQSLGFNILMHDEETASDYPDRAANFILDAFSLFREHGIYEDRMMRKLNAFCDGRLHLFDCAAAGGNQVIFAPDGAMGICHGYLGTRRNFVADVEQTDFQPSYNDTFIEWSKRSPVNISECRRCSALGICGGGCPFNAERESGSIWKLDNRFCAHSKTALEWLIWDLYRAATEGRSTNKNSD